MPATLLRIGELATQAGVSTRTVDHYTRLGLLTPAERTSGNYRLYRPGDVDRIALIQQLETHGVSLDQIAAALAAPEADLPDTLKRIHEDLRAVQAAIETAPPEAHGLLVAIATRVHGLLHLALHIPPDLFVP